MEFVPTGQIVNQTFYLDVLQRVRNSVRRKRPDMWRSGEWWFQHDNVHAHTTLSARQFWTKNGMTPLTHPPYSPDLAACDFFLFLRMNKDLKGNRFENVDEVKEKTTMALQGITLKQFQGCFQCWKTRLDRCIASWGEYF